MLRRLSTVKEGMERTPNKLVIFNYTGLTKEAVRLKVSPINLLNLLYFKPVNQQEEYKKFNCRIKLVMVGDNFLLNAKGLINSTVDLAYKLMYLEAASLRSYSYYKLTKYTHLDLDTWPDLNIRAVQTNPLLKLEGDYALRFLLEEPLTTSKN